MHEIIEKLARVQKSNDFVKVNGESCIITDIQAHKGYYPHIKARFVVSFYNTENRSQTSISTNDFSLFECIFKFKE